MHGYAASFRRLEHRVQEGDDKNLIYISQDGRSADVLDIEEYASDVYSTSLNFTNWDSATRFTYHEMLWISLNTQLIDIKAFVQQSNLRLPALARIETQDQTKKSIECADRICQSVDWFLEGHSKLTGRMAILVPSETARALFGRLCRDGTGDEVQEAALEEKKKFCEMTTQRIRDSGLPVWEE